MYLPQCYIPCCPVFDKCAVPTINPDGCPDEDCHFKDEATQNK